MTEYLIPEEIRTSSSPLLDFADGDLKMALMQGDALDPSMSVELVNLNEMSGVPTLNDFQFCYIPVVSEAFLRALPSPLPNGLSHCPVTFDFEVSGVEGPFHLLQIALEYRAIDKEESVYDGSKRIVYEVEKLCLDQDVLDELDPDDKVIFKLREMNSVTLWTTEIAESLIEKGLTGFKFFEVEEWRSGIMFKS